MNITRVPGGFFIYYNSELDKHFLILGLGDDINDMVITTIISASRKAKLVPIINYLKGTLETEIISQTVLQNTVTISELQKLLEGHRYDVTQRCNNYKQQIKILLKRSFDHELDGCNYS